ncbi:MAG: uL22 family ribosomal protein, partial [Nanoarchaeota archaeon]
EHKNMENRKETEVSLTSQPSSNKHEHTEKKVEVKKQEQKKRAYACLNANNLSISTKEGLHICDMIRYKKVDDAIKMCEEVTTMKRAVPMHNRECGHKKGMMGGRYPVSASKEFVKALKALKANAIYHGLEIENCIISECKTNMAARPYKRGGAKAKRSHVFMKLEPNKKKIAIKQTSGKLNHKKPKVS